MSQVDREQHWSQCYGDNRREGETGQGAAAGEGGEGECGRAIRSCDVFDYILITYMIQDQLLTLELHHIIGLKGWCVTTWQFVSALNFQASVDCHQICPLNCDYFTMDTAFSKPTLVTDS